MKVRLIIFCCLVSISEYSFSQSTRKEIGSGASFQIGLNPASEYFTWNTESGNILLQPTQRFIIGPSFRFKNYKTWQVEGSIVYSRTNFRPNDTSAPLASNITVNEWQLPLSLNYYADSPVRYHSAIVYYGGVKFKNSSIKSQANILNHYNFFTPAVFVGVRLATEVTSFGRFEYGVSYTKNLIESHILYAENVDSAPSQITFHQREGRWNLGLYYYINPRTYNWTKKRYQLETE